VFVGISGESHDGPVKGNFGLDRRHEKSANLAGLQGFRCFRFSVLENSRTLDLSTWSAFALKTYRP